MDIIDRIVDEINKLKLQNKIPCLILLGLKEKRALHFDLREWFVDHKEMPNRFYGIKVEYTEKQSELRVF